MWRETHPRVRAQVLYKIAATLQERAQEFAELYSLNSGGSVGTGLWTMYDVAGRRFEYYAGMADKIRGDTLRHPRPIHQLHAARAGRCHRPHRAVEWSAVDRQPHHRSGAGGRQLGGGQAVE